MSNEVNNLSKLRKKPHWSYSRINSLLSHCSLQWAFKYVYKAYPSFTPVNLVFGKAFHSTLTFVYNRLMNEQPLDDNEPINLFSELFSDECSHAEPEVKFGGNDSLDSLIQKGQQMIEVFTANIDPEEKILGVAVPFSVNLTDANGERVKEPLIGEFDCLVEKNGKPVIVDWKTAARRWPERKADFDLQPTCYLFARCLDTGVNDAEFRFDVVTKTKTPAFQSCSTDRNYADFVRLGETVRAMERRIESEAFYPDQQGFDCRNCPYTDECRSWHLERVHKRPVITAVAA